MKVKNLFLSMMCLATMAGTFTSCSDDDEIKYNGPVNTNTQLAYILNEGSYNANNSNISLYYPQQDSLYGNCYLEVNGQKLGDTGQDMIAYNNQIYVTLNGSKYIAKLDKACNEETRHAFTVTEGAPRYMVADGGYIYTTTYAHKVLKMNASTLEVVDSVNVQNNPEEIVALDGKLYCACSGYGTGNTVNVIDTHTFTVTDTIAVKTNPNNMLAVNGKVYVISWTDWTAYYLQEIDPTTKAVSTIGKATKMAAYGNTIYLTNSESDWSSYPYSTVTSFGTYDTTTGQLNTTSFLSNAPAALGSTSIYMLTINPNNGDIYIGTSDYVSNGNIYHFGKSGNYLGMFDAGGISPNHMVFL